MRQTKKFKAARELVLKQFPKRRDLLTMDHETLYECLFDEGWAWDNRGGWYQIPAEAKEFRGSLDSLFEDKDGLPSGVFRLRLMCHPDEIEPIVEEIKKHLVVGEVSNPYPNRKGPGHRVYLTCKRRKR